MASRLDLQELLETLLGSDKVYFQPPPNIQMVYPALVYKRDEISTEFANNKPYIHSKRYQITCIDRDPDSLIPDKIAALPFCVFANAFTANGLHHTVFTIYF